MEENELSILEMKKIKIMQLLPNVPDYRFVERFFDIDSNKMLDEKIQALTDLVNGKTIDEIPNFRNVFELYPKDDELWD